MASGQIKNAYTSIGEIDSSLSPSSLVLKLSVSPTYLRYFVISGSFRQVIYFGEHLVHHVTDSADLAKRIEKIFVKDEILQLPFGTTLTGFDSPYSLLPAELSFMATPGKLIQRCSGTGIDLIFEKDDAVLDALNEILREPKFLHLNSTFLQQLPDLYQDDTERLFLNITSSYFDIIHFNSQRKLQLMNRYHYKTESDFIYFTMLYCDEMKLNRETLQAVLIGEVDLQSKVYDACYRYFRDITFIAGSSGPGFAKAFDRYQKHLHFNLYNLSE